MYSLRTLKFGFCFCKGHKGQDEHNYLFSQKSQLKIIHRFVLYLERWTVRAMCRC
jgi:hypothetical protein